MLVTDYLHAMGEGATLELLIMNTSTIIILVAISWTSKSVELCAYKGGLQLADGYNYSTSSRVEGYKIAMIG